MKYIEIKTVKINLEPNLTIFNDFHSTGSGYEVLDDQFVYTAKLCACSKRISRFAARIQFGSAGVPRPPRAPQKKGRIHIFL